MTEARKSRQNPAIRDFILRTIPDHPLAIGSLVAEKFGISRTSANRYLKKLEAEALISAEGKTSARQYKLRVISTNLAALTLVPGISESDVYREYVGPYLKGAADNIDRICQYGFTEIFNNAIDHSASPDASIFYEQDYLRIQMTIADNGVGIFEKIQKDFNLSDPRSALLELSKGKLTSDKAKHSGEGIFFTSRMFNRFTILSGNLCYSRHLTDDWGWLIETTEMVEYTKGTVVRMELSTDAAWTPKEVFEKYQNEEMDFAKTHVPISLGKYGHEQLVSRSQAKRILARVDRFEEAMLDFQGVSDIGQAFADEIFRVYALEHPEVRITVLQANDDVLRMVARAKASNPSSPSNPPPGTVL